LEHPDLETLRKEVDGIDRQILDRLNERARMVFRIGAWKRQHGVPIYDPRRERALLDWLVACHEREGGALDAVSIRRIYERILDESRRLEGEVRDPKGGAS
jgi:3-deoxy-7-phosphoheptulonate synthase/chorismate mutase